MTDFLFIFILSWIENFSRNMYCNEFNINGFKWNSSNLISIQPVHNSKFPQITNYLSADYLGPRTGSWFYHPIIVGILAYIWIFGVIGHSFIFKIINNQLLVLDSLILILTKKKRMQRTLWKTVNFNF